MKKRKKTAPSDVSFELLYVEPFMEQDFKAVQGLLAELSPQKTLTPEMFARAINDNTVIVARLADKRIVGMATLAQHSAFGGMGYWVEDVVTARKYQGMGIGKKTMEKLIWVAKQTGIETLKLTSAKKRRPARALYRKLGFKLREDGDLFVLTIQ